MSPTWVGNNLPSLRHLSYHPAWHALHASEMWLLLAMFSTGPLLCARGGEGAGASPKARSAPKHTICFKVKNLNSLSNPVGKTGLVFEGLHNPRTPSELERQIKPEPPAYHKGWQTMGQFDQFGRGQASKRQPRLSDAPPKRPARGHTSGLRQSKTTFQAQMAQ